MFGNQGKNQGQGATTGGFSGFGLGGTGTTTTQASATPAAGGFTLGNPTVPKTTTTTGFGGFNFGVNPQVAASHPHQQHPVNVVPLTSGGGGFNFGATAVTSQQPQQTTGFSLSGGGQTSNNNSSQTTTTLGGLGGGGGGIFGIKQTTASTAAPTGSFTGFGTPSSASGTPATTSMLGSLLSGSSTPATTAPAQAPIVSSTAAASGFSFGAPSAAATSVAAPASSAPSTGFSLGTSLSQPTSSVQTSLGSGLTLSSFGTPASTATATSSLATSAASLPSLGGAAGPQKQMTFRQLEETINKWTTELEEQEKYFLDQATQVNAWDRIVMENGEKIIQLNKDVEKVKLDQQKLDHELDFVHSQQKELEDLLTPLEKALDSMPSIGYQQHADVEREHTYMLAESLDAQLKRMGQDLKEIIERLNSTNTKPDSNDPMQQITKILNAHVMSLMWVDRNSVNLGRRVEEIAKQMDVEKREQERNFRLAYN